MRIMRKTSMRVCKKNNSKKIRSSKKNHSKIRPRSYKKTLKKRTTKKRGGDTPDNIKKMIEEYKQKINGKFDDEFLNKSLWQLKDAYELFQHPAQPDMGHDDLIGMNIDTNANDLRMLINQKLLEDLFSELKTPIPDQQKDAFDDEGNLIKQNNLDSIKRDLEEYRVIVEYPTFFEENPTLFTASA